MVLSVMAVRPISGSGFVWKAQGLRVVKGNEYLVWVVPPATLQSDSADYTT